MKKNFLYKKNVHNITEDINLPPEEKEETVQNDKCNYE